MKKVLLFLMFAFVLFGCSKDNDISISISQSVLLASKKIVKNGETISLTADIKGEANGNPISFSVTYFCDQNEIGHSNDSSSNYCYEYKVQNLSVGTHTLSYKADFKYEDTYSSSTAAVPLVVTE